MILMLRLMLKNSIFPPSIQSPALANPHYSFQRFFSFSLSLSFSSLQFLLATQRKTINLHIFFFRLFSLKSKQEKGKQKNRKITLSNKQKAKNKKKKIVVFFFCVKNAKHCKMGKQKEIKKREWSKSPFGCRTTRRRVLLVEIINVLLRFIASNVSWNASEWERERVRARIKLNLKIDA